MKLPQRGNRREETPVSRGKKKAAGRKWVWGGRRPESGVPIRLLG